MPAIDSLTPGFSEQLASKQISIAVRLGSVGATANKGAPETLAER
jgi:hypothetical protein